NPRANEIQRLGRGVPVRYEAASKPGLDAALENRLRPFSRDQWFVVTGYNEFGMAVPGNSDKLLGRHRTHRRQRCRVAQRLAGRPILAIRAMEIATHHAKGERVTSRIDVEVGLLLDRIAL